MKRKQLKQKGGRKMGLIQDFQKTGEERRHEIKQLQTEVGKIRSEVANMLKEFTNGDRKRASEVNDYMNAEVGKIRASVATMVKDMVKSSAERRSEVAAIAQEATAIVEAADTFVKDLSRGSTERRSEVASIHEMVWGKSPIKKVAAPIVTSLPRKAPPVTPVAEQAPADKLRDKVFAYLTNHPNGTRLTELEEEFGVARIQTARVVRELMDGSKVEKRDLLYFTI